MLFLIALILGLVASTQAQTCGSTTTLTATPVTFNVTGPTNCNLTFAASAGFSTSCTMKFSGTAPSTCTNDKLNLLSGNSVVGSPYCGVRSFTLTSSYPSLTFRIIIGTVGSTLKCTITRTPPTTTPAPTTITTAKVVQGNCTCGISTVNRIIGGTNATANKYPWQVRLIFSSASGSFLCGGTLISQDYVLTAAHCVVGMATATVYLGDLSQSTLQTYEAIVKSTNFIVHSLWNSTTLANDIALLKLPSPVALNPGIQLACLPFKYVNSTFAGNVCRSTGWGKTADNGNTADILQQTNLTVVTNTVCTQSYGSIILSSMICAKQNGTSTCQGDSGGPLGFYAPTSVTNQNRMYVVGVVSFGNGAGCALSPSVFTRVTSYLGWIQEKTGETFCNV